MQRASRALGAAPLKLERQCGDPPLADVVRALGAAPLKPADRGRDDRVLRASRALGAAPLKRGRHYHAFFVVRPFRTLPGAAPLKHHDEGPLAGFVVTLPHPAGRGPIALPAAG